MYSNCYSRQNPSCANCGKPNKGIMNSSSWGHNEDCCSDACGKRLGQRIENGMIYIKSDNSFWGRFKNNDSERIDELRFRIKHLEKQLKLIGCKPRRTIFKQEGEELDED